MSEEAAATPAAVTTNAGEAANVQNETTAPAANGTAEAPAQPNGDKKPEGGADAKPQEATPDKKTETTDTKAAAAPPEKYELKLPEGSKLTQSKVDQVALYAKENGLSNEVAQKLLERESQAVQEFESEIKSEHLKRVEQWKSEVEADKELGGDLYKQNVELAKRVAHRYASPEFLKVLDESGFGNHPELVRVFSRIGKQMSEDQLIMPGAQSGGNKPIEDFFYGQSNKN